MWWGAEKSLPDVSTKRSLTRSRIGMEIETLKKKLERGRRTCEIINPRGKGVNSIGTFDKCDIFFKRRGGGKQM